MVSLVPTLYASASSDIDLINLGVVTEFFESLLKRVFVVFDYCCRSYVVFSK